MTTTTHRTAPRTLTSSGPTAGVAVCVLAAGMAMGLNRLLPTVSPLLVAIVLGTLAAHTVRLPERLRPGLQFSSKRLLRAGIALLGLHLLIGDVLGLGWKMILAVTAVVVLGIVGTMALGARMGLSWTQRILIACGFSICGAAAVAAVDGVVDGEEEEVVTAVALVVVFGTLMILAIPLASDLVGLSVTDAGLWAGASVHEVAQVVAVGGVLGGAALGVAVVAKLARVLLLAPVVAFVAVASRRRGAVADAKHPPLVPLFVVVFVGFVALRSTGVVPVAVLDAAGFAQTALLSAAMFALGTSVHVSALRRVGAAPVLLGAASTVWVALVALTGVVLAGW